MIKLEHTVLPSPEQMEFIIEGMRNPMNSWDKSDSETWLDAFNNGGYSMPTATAMDENIPLFKMGPNDFSLMQKLSAAGTDHRKFMRQMPVMIRITAPLYWWKEFDTYKVGTVANSCSTMHKITDKEFTLNDFSTDHLTASSLYILKQIISDLNFWREAYLINDNSLRKDYILNRFTSEYTGNSFSKKDCWWQLIQLLPSSYNQTRNVMMNYEVLHNIYHARKDHKLDEWHVFCDWIEKSPYSCELIIFKEETNDVL